MFHLVNNTRGYHGHRERQRDRILMIAEQLFIRDGVDNVSIAETTASTGVGILFDWGCEVVNKSN
jgi:AcrR family transcriptional regulator